MRRIAVGKLVQFRRLPAPDKGEAKFGTLALRAKLLISGPRLIPDDGELGALRQLFIALSWEDEFSLLVEPHRNSCRRMLRQIVQAGIELDDVGLRRRQDHAPFFTLLFQCFATHLYFPLALIDCPSSTRAVSVEAGFLMMMMSRSLPGKSSATLAINLNASGDSFAPIGRT